MSERKCFCEMIYDNQNKCNKSFIKNNIQLIYCDIHFELIEEENFLKNQYFKIKNNFDKNFFVIKSFICQLILLIDDKLDTRNLENIKNMRAICNCKCDTRKLSRLDICIDHLIELYNQIKYNIKDEVKDEVKNNIQHEIKDNIQHEIKDDIKDDVKYIFPDVNEIEIHENIQFEKPKDCPICFDSLKDENKSLSCGHWVHYNCINEWKKSQKFNHLKCPVCRANVKYSNQEERLVSIKINRKMYESEAIKLFLKCLHKVLFSIKNKFLDKIFTNENKHLIASVIDKLLTLNIKC